MEVSVTRKKKLLSLVPALLADSTLHVLSVPCLTTYHTNAFLARLALPPLAVLPPVGNLFRCKKKTGGPVTLRAAGGLGR